MQKSVKDALLRLKDLVRDEWDGQYRIRITDAYDSEGEHGPESLHYEGRALDLTVWNTNAKSVDTSKHGRLAMFAYRAGFDWVWYEDTNHIHISMKKDGSID